MFLTGKIFVHFELDGSSTFQKTRKVCVVEKKQLEELE